MTCGRSLASRPGSRSSSGLAVGGRDPERPHRGADVGLQRDGPGLGAVVDLAPGDRPCGPPGAGSGPCRRWGRRPAALGRWTCRTQEACRRPRPSARRAAPSSCRPRRLQTAAQRARRRSCPRPGRRARRPRDWKLAPRLITWRSDSGWSADCQSSCVVVFAPWVSTLRTCRIVPCRRVQASAGPA